MIETRSIVGGVGALLLLSVGIAGASDVRVVQAVRDGDCCGRTRARSSGRPT